MSWQTTLNSILTSVQALAGSISGGLSNVNISKVNNVTATQVATGQNSGANSLPVVLANDTNVGNTDAGNETTASQAMLGYLSGGPLNSSSVPQRQLWDRLRTWQGKGTAGSSTNIVATTAGDTSLTFNSAVASLEPGQAIYLSVGASATIVEVVYVSTAFIRGSTTTVALQTPVVNSGSTTAKWDNFIVAGPGTTNMLPGGILPTVVCGYDPNLGRLQTAIMGGLDARDRKTILEIMPALINSAGTVDAQRGNLDNITLLASAAHTTTQTASDQTNYNGRGVTVVLDVTNAGTGSITLEIDGKDPVSGKYFALLTGAAVTSNSTNVYTVYPGATVTANVSASTFLPRTWRVVVTANNANSITYSVGAIVNV